MKTQMGGHKCMHKHAEDICYCVEACSRSLWGAILASVTVHAEPPVLLRFSFKSCTLYRRQKKSVWCYNVTVNQTQLRKHTASK